MAKTVWEVIRMVRASEEAEKVKNSERAPYTETELKELSKEELQGLYLGFYGKTSGRLRESGLIKAILEAESEISEKETGRMARMTMEHARSAIRAATTEAEVKAILECLTKAQIFEIGLEILRSESTPYASMTDKKAKIVEYFAYAIKTVQTIERIESQRLDEKAESLLEEDFNVVREVVESLGVYEQIWLLSKYGIPYEEIKQKGRGYGLKVNLQYTLLEKICKYKDELREHLSKQSRTETNDTANPDNETVTMVKTNEVTTEKTKTLALLQGRVEVLKGRYELYCLRVKTAKYHLRDVKSKENRRCYEVMKARDEYKNARYERFRTYVEYRKTESELRAATEIRNETITMTEKAKLTVNELDEANADESANPETPVQRVMTEIKNAGYDPKATREILKAQTFNFQQAMLQIMDGGYGSMFDEQLRISDLSLCVKGIKDTKTRQRYIENAVMCIKNGRKNLEYFRNTERFQEYIPMHEEWQKYYDEWQEYLESYEGKKELSA